MCEKTDDEIIELEKIQHHFAYTHIAVAFIIIIFTRFAYKWTKDLAERYDERTITPSDYTLFFRLDPEQNEIFNRTFYKPDLANE